MSKKKTIRFEMLSPLPTMLRLDLWPFLIVYAALIYYYCQLEDDSIYVKLLMIAICFIHCLIFIFGHWSKRFRAFIQFRRLRGTIASNLEKAGQVFIQYDKEGQNTVYEIVDFFKEENEKSEVTKCK
jgi:hypothetical protein